MCIFVIEHNSARINKLRRIQQVHFSKKYDGWCNLFDSQFDSNSEWFEDTESKSFCRVTYKSNLNKIPIELGEQRANVAVESNSCEINNFIYPDNKSAIKLISYVLKHISNLGIGKIYCVVDTENHSTIVLNTKIFQFKLQNINIVFNGIYVKGTTQKVRWHLLGQSSVERGMTIKQLNGELCKQQ